MQESCPNEKLLVSAQLLWLARLAASGKPKRLFLGLFLQRTAQKGQKHRKWIEKKKIKRKKENCVAQQNLYNTECRKKWLQKMKRWKDGWKTSFYFFVLRRVTKTTTQQVAGKWFQEVLAKITEPQTAWATVLLWLCSTILQQKQALNWYFF